jgi:Mesyanzhinovviridae exonuclease
MDVMLDLETLATSPDAMIIQIGACAFDPRTETIGETFHCNVNVLDCILREGFRIDEDTVAWWRDQSDKSHLMSEQLPLGSALLAFKMYFDKYGGLTANIWSHGAAFDVPVLDNAYTQMGFTKPWHYRNVRDTRTLYKVAESFGWTQPELHVAHHASSDAIEQALTVQAACCAIWRP